LLEEQTQAERVVRLAINVDLMLAARLVREAKLAFWKQISRLILALELPIHLKAELVHKSLNPELVGKTRSNSSISKMHQQLEDIASDVSWIKANEFLNEIGSALGNIIGSEAAIPGLPLHILNDSDSNVRGFAVYVLGKIGSEAAIPELLQRLDDSDTDVRGEAAEALCNIEKKHANTLSPHLPHLLTLIPTESGKDAHRVIHAIQENCKYYNYEIYQTYLETQKRDQSEGQTSNHSKIINKNFPNATEIKIFENINQYHEAPPKDSSS
jgi:HEAT repeat protein